MPATDPTKNPNTSANNDPVLEPVVEGDEFFSQRVARCHPSVKPLIDEVAYLGDNVEAVLEACEFAEAAHEGQARASGEHYISHPVAVARILAGMQMDVQTILAALLHDVIEDTHYSKEELAERFGEPVAELVDGVSKIESLENKPRHEAQADNVQKLLLAAARDIRVVLIKLTDRLHNMRTLDPLKPAKKRRVAQETLDIYAPIANRLGVNKIRKELEDLAFKTIYPWRYRVLRKTVRFSRKSRSAVTEQVETLIRSNLEKEGLHARVSSREKHLFGIYRKLKSKVHLGRQVLSFANMELELDNTQPLEEVNAYLQHVRDIYGIRIVTQSVGDCYRALGVVHNLYKPVLQRFKDYVAIPKINGYQSLHTGLRGPGGVPIEVQIRTEDMHQVAEVGVAAHWLYKAGDHTSQPHERMRDWLKSVLDLQQKAGDSLEFLENVKMDLYPHDVYVFSPKGDIQRMPRGATAVDFAYAIHTSVGNHCVGVRVDGQIMPLRSQLQNGQTIEIVTRETAKPNPGWLKFVVTAKARSHIRHFLKKMQTNDAIALGHKLLTHELKQYGLSVDHMKDERLQVILHDMEFGTIEELYASIALGERIAALVASRFAKEHGKNNDLPDSSRKRVLAEDPMNNDSGPLIVQGTEGMVVSLGRCCHPLPGDRVISYISSGKGVVVHRETCRNLASLSREPDRLLELEWSPQIERDHPASIVVDVSEGRGVLASIASRISELNVNIEDVVVHDHDNSQATINFTVNVRDKVQLNRVMARLTSIDEVIGVRRG